MRSGKRGGHQTAYGAIVLPWYGAANLYPFRPQRFRRALLHLDAHQKRAPHQPETCLRDGSLVSLIPTGDPGGDNIFAWLSSRWDLHASPTVALLQQHPVDCCTLPSWVNKDVVAQADMVRRGSSVTNQAVLAIKSKPCLLSQVHLTPFFPQPIQSVFRDLASH